MRSKRIIRQMTALALAAILALTLAGCGSGDSGAAQVEEPAAAQAEEPAEEQSEVPVAASEEASSEEASSEEAASVEQEVHRGGGGLADKPGYITAYRGLVKEMSDAGVADQFMLAKIDGDEIWELLASSSEGSFNQENTFIYTFHNDEPVLLASVIAGSDGASLSYSENNLIRQTGSMAGMTDVYSSIADGVLKEEFRAEMINTFETDAAGDEVFSYTVNGKEVSKEEYEKQLADFNAKNAPFVVIDSEGLNVMDFKDGEFVEGTQLAYWTAEDTLSELDSIDNK